MNSLLQTENSNKEIHYIGNIRGNKPQGYTGSVYLRGGISPTLLSRDYKDPILIVTKLDISKKAQANTKAISCIQSTDLHLV